PRVPGPNSPSSLTETTRSRAPAAASMAIAPPADRISSPGCGATATTLPIPAMWTAGNSRSAGHPRQDASEVPGRSRGCRRRSAHRVARMVCLLFSGGPVCWSHAPNPAPHARDRLVGTDPLPADWTDEPLTAPRARVDRRGRPRRGQVHRRRPAAALCAPRSGPAGQGRPLQRFRRGPAARARPPARRARGRLVRRARQGARVRRVDRGGAAHPRGGLPGAAGRPLHPADPRPVPVARLGGGAGRGAGAAAVGPQRRRDAAGAPRLPRPDPRRREARGLRRLHRPGPSRRAAGGAPRAGGQRPGGRPAGRAGRRPGPTALAGLPRRRPTGPPNLGKSWVTGLDQSGIPALTMSSMTPPLRTERLLIRDWSVDDAEAAYRIYGSSEVARW